MLSSGGKLQCGVGMIYKVRDWEVEVKIEGISLSAKIYGHCCESLNFLFTLIKTT